MMLYPLASVSCQIVSPSLSPLLPAPNTVPPKLNSLRNTAAGHRVWCRDGTILTDESRVMVAPGRPLSPSIINMKVLENYLSPPR